jgi:beta-lactamase superfamily II metal-dependent hydrolase
MRSRSRKTVSVAVAILALALVATLAALIVSRLAPEPDPPAPPSPIDTSIDTPALDMVVSVIDVGQGDSILITSEGQAMLVDAGDKDSGDEVVAYLEGMGIDELDYLVATHPDADHIGGMAEVLAAYDVANDVIAPDATSDTATYEGFAEAVADEPGVGFARPDVGESFTLGDATIEVIANGEEATDTNDASIVLRIVCGDRSVLLTGDISASVERRLVEDGLPLDSDVLKVAHHGSHNSSDEAFLRAVSPKYAVISAGANNSYGHPRAETLERLSAAGAVIYRTDIHGTVVFSFSDGKITAKAA